MGNAAGWVVLSTLAARARSAGLRGGSGPLGITVQSSRALGVFALAAVILAAISFAAVDVVITTAPHDTLPVAAVTYALIGTFALLASVIPAFIWLGRSISHPRHDDDIEPIPVAVKAALDNYREEEL